MNCDQQRERDMQIFRVVYTESISSEVYYMHESIITFYYITSIEYAHAVYLRFFMLDDSCSQSSIVNRKYVKCFD